MYFLISCFLVFAQQARYDRGLMIFKLGVTGVGVAFLIAAAGVMFSQPKDQSKEMSPAVKMIAALIIGSLGVGTIGYAWLAF